MAIRQGNRGKLFEESLANTTGANSLMYIIPIDKPSERLEIQYTPNDLTIVRNPGIDAVSVVGRNLPHYQYVGGDRTLKLSLDFYADTSNRSEVLEKCKWLERLTYNEGFGKPPQRIHLIFGEVFESETWTINKLSYRLLNFHIPSGLYPLQGYVTLGLVQDEENNIRRSNF